MHTLLQNVSYGKESLKAFPPYLLVGFVQQFRLPRYTCTLILAMLFLKAATPQAPFTPPPRGGWGDPHPCSAARALQDQLPFRSQTNTVISLLSSPGWISRWAGSCGDVNKKQALSGALFSLQGVLSSRDEPGLFRLKVGVWKAYRSSRFLVSLGWGVQCQG